MLTTRPNPLAATVHDRMPVIVAPEDFARWLSPSPPGPDLAALFEPRPAEEMVAYPVSRAVNRPANDSPDCIEPLVSPA